MLSTKLDTFLLNSSLQYYIIPVLILYFTYSITTYQNPCFLLWVIHVLFPLLDYLLPLDQRNPTKAEQNTIENQHRFKFPLYLAVILDWCALFYVQHWYFYNAYRLSYAETLLLFLSGGYSGASNINIAHELLHKDNFIDKFLGLLTLSKNLYLHFYIEHTHGHHKRVATREDPASSRRDESLYTFLPRTLVGSWVSAWKYEEKRLGTSEFSLKNRMHLFGLCYCLFVGSVNLVYGIRGVMLFVTSAVISVVFLETINYIEHYGLERKELSPGVYEKVSIVHSWNAPHRLTNYLLFKLQRHSDHHENSYKPYQTLCTYERSPQLPHGYTVCLLLAASPKAWFSVMNPLLDEYKKETSSETNKKNKKKRDLQVLSVVLQHAVIFTVLWGAELLGLTKLI